MKEYRLPAGAEHLKEYLKDQFPGDAKSIEQMMDYSVDLFAQVRRLKAISTLRDKLVTPFIAPKVVANLNTTYSAFLDRFGITNPELRELMDTFTSFAGVPRGRVSSILTTGAMLSSVSRCFRPVGHFDGFPAALAAAFQKRGGEIRLRSEVTQFLFESGGAARQRRLGRSRGSRRIPD
ncbi:MAG: hypothetical protein P1P77_09925 [Spirochaetaceae bacterium]|nr:hypothetical protein [Spirochaetaceae bacterium]